MQPHSINGCAGRVPKRSIAFRLNFVSEQEAAMSWFCSNFNLYRCAGLIVCAISCGVQAQTPESFLAAASFAQQPPVRSEEPTHFTVTPELQGDVMMAHQRYVAALDAYRQAPMESAVIWNKMGVANHHMFNLKEAQRDYEKALKMKPAFPEAQNNLGAVHYGLKDYREAEHCYKKAIKLNPKSATFYSNLGTAYLAQGKYKKSGEAYRTALALDPNVFESDPTTKISEIGPSREMATLNYLLAKTYAQAGRKNEALIYLRKALNGGYCDRKKILGDKEFAVLHDMPEFQSMLSEPRN
jgi:tetratricopeptide (TPR) repeat protein